MRGLLERDHPILIVEDNTPEVLEYLWSLRYSHEKIEGSSNCIFRMAHSNGRNGEFGDMGRIILQAART